jgi:hypothetical protein
LKEGLQQSEKKYKPVVAPENRKVIPIEIECHRQNQQTGYKKANARELQGSRIGQTYFDSYKSGRPEQACKDSLQ